MKTFLMHGIAAVLLLAGTAAHAISLGFYEGELLRRVDPKHRTLGQVFDDEIRKPLGIDAYIRVPETLPSARIALITNYQLLKKGYLVQPE